MRPTSATPQRGAALRERLAGYGLALYLVSGSWSFARVMPIESSLITEPRSWAVALLVVLALSPARGGRPVAQQRARHVLLGTELLWLGFTLLAITWAPDLELATVDAVDLGLLISVAIALHRLGRTADIEALATSLRRGLSIVLLMLAAVAVLGGIGSGRLAVLGGGPNVFGRNMGLLCVLAVERAVFASRDRIGPGARSAWLVIATVAIALVVLSGSRGAMIASAFAAALLFVLGRGAIGRRTAAVFVLVALTLGMLLLTSIGARVIESFGIRVIDLLISDGYVSGRDQVYATALERGREEPVIGHGLASFAAHTRWAYAHNIVLDAWFETGAIGVALLGLYLGGFARSLRQIGSEGRELWIAAAALILAGSQFSGDRYDTRGFMVFASVCLAVPAAQILRRRQPAGRGSSKRDRDGVGGSC